ncbi:unnamed protein product [Cyclocybe aegerita]|uniref:Uncharacterized protein n=1 Tax=Cyclocybe aegerita TaxID=1973307 RepID=A0A8S0WIR6_CYCAE|nr:unnamed protein product [Cyclocybe aegerita]
MSENRRPTMDIDITLPNSFSTAFPTNTALSTPKPTKPKHVDFAALSLTGGRKARSRAAAPTGAKSAGKGAGAGAKGEKEKKGQKRRVSVPMATRRSNLAESLSEEEDGEGEDGMDVDVDEDEQQRKELEKKERTHLAVEVDTQRMQLISPPPEEVLVLERGRSVSGHGYGHGRRESTTNVYPYAPNTLTTSGRSPGAALTTLRLNTTANNADASNSNVVNRNANASNTGSGSSKRKRPQAASASAAFTITPSSSRSSKGSTSPEEEEEEDASMTIDGGHDYEQQQQYQEEHEQHEPVEATPNPKPRKQGRLARVPSMAGSPTKGSFASGEMVRRSPMGMDKARAQGKREAQVEARGGAVAAREEPVLPVAVEEDQQEEEDPLGSLKLKNPSVRRAVLSSRGSRRSATPIPPYEPPTDVFTPPREVFISPISAPPRSSRKSTAAAASSKKKGKGLRVNTLIMQTQVKQEIPDDIDLSAPMPPASPTDDPLLLSGPPEPEPGAVLEQEEEEVVVQRRSVEVQVQMEAPDLPPSSPEPPLDTDDAEAVDAFDWHREAADTSIDSSMMLDDPADAEVEPVRLFDFPLGDTGGGWSDSDDDEGAENVPKGGALESEGEGEYTGHWRTLKVPTKQDPPSSATRCRMEDWGRPISPFPYQRAMPLVGEEEQEEEEVRRMSVEPEVHVQQHHEEEAREEEEVRRMSVEPEPEPEPEQVQVQQEVPEIVQVPEAVDASPEDDEESSDGDDDPGLVKITSADPRAAARAVAILKQHDYECCTKLVKRRRVSLDDIARDNRRKSLAAHGVSKTKTKNGAQARSRRSMGVIGERVYIPGSPVVTLPELLEQVEKDVVEKGYGHGQQEAQAQVWRERREREDGSQVFETPVPARSKSANANAFDFERRLSSLSTTTTFPSLLPLAVDSEGGDGPRPWTKDAWKLLDACFTDQRLELGTDGSLANVESVDVDHVVQRFVEICGGWEKVGTFGDEWDRESLLQRAEALKKKQRGGKVAPPTTPGLFTSVATRASGSFVAGSFAFASPSGLRQLKPVAQAHLQAQAQAQARGLEVSNASNARSGTNNSGNTSLGALNRNRAPPPPRRSLLGPSGSGSGPGSSSRPVPPPPSNDGPFQNLGPEDDDEQDEDNGPRRRKRLPGSLLAPRYSHLLEEARAVSGRGLGVGGGKEREEREEREQEQEEEVVDGDGDMSRSSIEGEGDDTSQDASASFDDSNDDQHPDEEDDDEPTLHTQLRSTQPAQPRPSTISTRVKGFLFSYLPTLSTSTLAAKSKSLKPVKQQRGLPLPPPPPSLLTKPRKPVQTPAKPAPARGPVPKELVNLHNVPLPQPKVGKGRRDPPRRLVELVPVPQEVLDKTVNVLEKEKRGERGRRSSGSSVRDLIKGFEEMEREQEQEQKGKGGGRGKGRSGSTPPAIPPLVAGTSSFGGDALPISPDPTSTRATYLTVVPSRSRHTSPRRRSRSTTGSAHSSADESDSGTAHPQEMEIEGTQGGEEVSRDPSVDLFLGQYALKFRDTVEDLPGDLEVLTTSIAKATDWVLRAVHHNPLSIDGGDAFVAQMMSFVNAIMATNFSRIRGPGELDNFSLASLLEAEMSSKDEPTIHPAPVFRPPPPAAHGPLSEGVIDVGAPPDVLMQALDDPGHPASLSCIPASKKRKGVARPVPPPPPPPPQKSKVAYSHPGLPLPINHATKPKPHPTTWAGIA